MATGIITNIIKDPSGTPVPECPVIIRLNPKHCWRADASEVYPELRLTSSSGGAWSATLEKNVDLTPAGSYYEIEERLDEGSRTWRVLSTGVTTLQQATDPTFVDTPVYGTYPLSYDGLA